MTNDRDIQKLLEQTATPGVVEGPHRRQLRDRLLTGMRQGGKTVRTNLSPATARLLKIAAVVLAAAALVSTGWAAEKVYQEVEKRYFRVHPPETVWEGTIVTPSGKELYVSSSRTILTGDDSVSDEEWKEILSQKHYTLVKKAETEFGPCIYKYLVTLSDGSQVTKKFYFPLEEIQSVEELRNRHWPPLEVARKQEADEAAKISEALAAGRYRLINAGATRAHICRDVETGQKLYVQQSLFDSKNRAYVWTHPLSGATEGYVTNWENHLREIAEGRRELLRLELTERYRYEVTFADGTTTTFTPCEPLDDPEED